MSVKKVNFKANAAVKDIVGRGLIYDDNIAIIELVKNAKDAGSESAVIKFHNELDGGKDSSIVVMDSGKGMNFDEVVNKWLNIAYSEKKGAMLNDNSPYAGNKGVGRFSCDRLGSKLVLYTKSDSGDYLKLPINWQDFENKDQDDEISTISLECQILDKKTFLEEIDEKDFKKGTVLKIQDLRSTWTDRKLKKLIAELEKFSPSLDQGFEVYLYSTTKREDEDLQKKLNKKIDNNILEKLAFKTTFIKSSIDAAGEIISTSLFYQGDELYTYHAKNPYKNLKNISVEIHYLDTLAKMYFTKKIGVSPNSYGSIFLFYNGFRISPYGNYKNDWLGLDQRKSQGTARNLGTREIFGRIDILDDDNTFSVITSREGLAHNDAYFDLIAFDPEEKTTLKDNKESYGYVTTIIRQLENFVVSGLEWNRVIDRLAPEDSMRVIQTSDIEKDPNRYQLKTISSDKIKEACDRVLKSDLEIIDFKINDDLILQVQKIAEDKYKQYVDDFVEKTKNKTLKELSSSEKGAIKKIVTEEKAKTEAAKEERDYAEQQRDKAEKEVKEQNSQNIFLRSVVSQDLTNVISLHHHVGIAAGVIENYVKSVTRKIQSGRPVSESYILEILEKISLQAKKITATTQFATKANFNLTAEKATIDVCNYISEYLLNICAGVIRTLDNRDNISFIWENSESVEFIKEFRPMELSIVLDNLISNSRKAKADEIKVWVSESSNSTLKIIYKDNGAGISKDKVDNIFDLGYTTTDGSGLGLYQVKKILKTMHSKITLKSNSRSGVEFELEFKK